MTATRKTLGRNTTFGTRERVFETDEGIEVESTDQYELTRKRVLFEDIVLVTIHREVGWAFLLANGLLVTVFLIIAFVTYFASGRDFSAMIIAAFAVPSAIALAIRLFFKVSVVSVFGRRSRAKVRFLFSERRARELYGHLCARARQIQREIEEENVIPESAESHPQPFPAPPPDLLH